MQKSILKFTLFLSFFVFCTLYFLLHPTGVVAQVPNPPVPCGNVENPEFNSLRPYQVSVCTLQTASSAKYCGNDLTLRETVTGSYPGNGDCKTVENSIICNFTQEVAPHTVTIDLTGANLPIMGNTEDVLNSQNATDTLTSADKMNGYVSWYLNGVTNRAEYGNSENTQYNAVNFSGPIQKLLPGSILDAQRVQSISAAGTSSHDQIVACGKSNLGIIGDILKMGTLIPINCYAGNGTPADTVTSSMLRLSAWNGNLSLFNTAANTLTEPARKLIDYIAEKLPSVLRNTIEQSVVGFWNKKTPPLPWDDGTGKPFTTDLLYRKAYNEWRGKTCVIVPLANWLVCLDNVLVPNKYADLFPYIPLSSTEDVTGQIAIDKASTAANSNTDGTALSKVAFTDQSGTGQASSKLYFAHMAEASEEASLLQNTFVPKGQDQVGSPTNVDSGTSCKNVEVRTNKGDNLFADSITGMLGYTARFSCEFTAPTSKTDCYSRCIKATAQAVDYCKDVCSNNNTTTQTCSKDVYISLSTTSSTPLVDDIWSRLVAGPMAIFKRIFPKTNTEGSVGQIVDIAGSTNITYSGTGVQSNTDLKLPHIGGISEYFLKGIQTALRPKGYGESIEFSPNSENSCKSSVMPVLPTVQGACALKSTVIPGASSNKMPPTLVSILEAAGQTYNVPPGLIVGIMYGEGLFDGINKKNWTEDNVKSWATCAMVPNCNESGDDNFMGFNGNNWDDPANGILSDLQKLDPTKTKADRCNLLDAIYGVAWNLHDNADGNGGLPATCFGIALNAPVPSSCSWTPEQYESAIKVSESGYTSACHTNEGSCIGGASIATCPGGDNCETISNRYQYPNLSHNGCIWNVAHNY